MPQNLLLALISQKDQFKNFSLGFTFAGKKSFCIPLANNDKKRDCFKLETVFLIYFATMFPK